MMTWDGGGNFPPQRSLIRALIARGNEVFVLAHDTQKEAVQHDGAVFVRLDSVVQIDIAAIKDDSEVLAHVFAADGFGIDLHVAIERLAPDALLIDIALASALRVAAEQMIPVAAFCTGPYAFFERTPFLAALRPVLDQCSVILGQGYRQFDPVASPPANLVHVGPMRPADSDAPAFVRRRPDRPLLLVGLSTTQQHQGPLLQRLCDALGRLDVEGLVTTGRALAPESLHAPPNVTVVRHASHDLVLAEANLLITHAGMGTVLAGLAHGVPMLCLPMGRDQPLNAERVAELGLGSVLQPDASIEALKTEIVRLLADDAMKSRCQIFSKGVSSHPGVEAAAELIERLTSAAS